MVKNNLHSKSPNQITRCGVLWKKQVGVIFITEFSVIEILTDLGLLNIATMVSWHSTLIFFLINLP